MSRTAGRSHSTFAERLQKQWAAPPGDYILSWRMNLAGEMLRNQKLSIAEAAIAGGYESEAAFAQAFRREVGESPGRFRTSIQTPEIPRTQRIGIGHPREPKAALRVGTA